MSATFTCHQCGKCCTNLFKDQNTGLSLLPEETYLFPDEKIQPVLGIGSFPEDALFQVILYNYQDKECMHLKGTKCTSYDNRVTVCQSYPFRYFHKGTKPSYEVAPECPAIQELVQNTHQVNKTLQEIQAAQKLGKHLTKFYTSDETKWKYNQDEKTWVKLNYSTDNDLNT